MHSTTSSRPSVRPLAGQHRHASPTVSSGPPDGQLPPMNYMSNSPRTRSLSPTLMTIAPQHNQPLRDWEGFALQAEQQARSPVNPSVSFNRPGQQPRTPTHGYAPPIVKREGSPSVGVLREATERGNANYQRFVKANETTPQDLRQLPSSPYHGTPNRAGVDQVQDRSAALLDHQGYLAWKRDEFRRRQEAEARGEVFTPRNYNAGGGGGGGYLMEHGDVTRGSAITSRGVQPISAGGGRDTRTNIDFTGRRRDLLVQVLATADEIAWLQPPPIPDPIGWNGFWDLTGGHELVLQHMAISGANPQNSPSLTEHFMYPELLSCFQRTQVGTYLIRYHSGGEPPHERYFYVKSLPLANKAQYAPFLCWSQHKGSHNAMDAIPLVNVIWVTQGMHSPNFRKYYIGGNAIRGPYVGKHRIEALAYGCFTVWFYDGRDMKGIDLLATDPLVFVIWMKLMEDMAHLNASLDVTGKVRRMQRHLENLREEGLLQEYGVQGEKKKSFFQQFSLSGEE